MPKRKPNDSAFHKSAGAAAADAAVEGRPDIAAHTAPDAPHSRRARPLREGEKHDHLAEKKQFAESDEEARLDEGLEETFPGSDPVSANHFT